MLALAGIVYGLSGNGRQKEDPNKPKAEEKKEEKQYPKLARGPEITLPPPGEPISPVVWTKAPTKYIPDGTWTLEATAARKYINHIAYQPGGSLVALGSEDGTLRLYEAASGKFVKAFVTRNVCRFFAWTPDGKYLIVPESNLNATRIWDVETGRIVREFDKTLLGCVVSRDGKRLAGIPGDSTVAVYDLTKIDKPVELALRDSLPGALAWHPEATQLLVGYNDGYARFWGMTAPKPEVAKEFDAQIGAVVGAAWHSDGRYAIGGATGCAVWVNGKRAAKVGEGGAQLSSLSWSPKGDLLAVHSSNHSTGFVADYSAAEVKGLDERATFGVWFQDGQQLKLGTLDSAKGVRHFDPAGKLLLTFPTFDHDSVYSAQKGHFVPPAKGDNPFVFVVQTKDGQKTYTPDEFEKLTKGEKGDKPGWKNDPDSLK